MSKFAQHLRAAWHLRSPGPNGATVESVDEVKRMLRGLIRDLGGSEPARQALRRVATATAFPTGADDGARPVVQHRRRIRRAYPDRLPQPGTTGPAAAAARAAAEALFTSVGRETAG